MSQPDDLIARSHFTTADLDSRHKYGAWEDSISVIFDVSPTEDTMTQPFEAEVESFMIGSMMVARCSTKFQTFSRGQQTIARDGMDHILLQFFMEGGCNILTQDRAINVYPGDIQIFDMAQELRTLPNSGNSQQNSNNSLGYTNISVFIARDHLEELMPDVHLLHLSIIRSDTTLNRILRNYFLTLYEGASAMSNKQADVLLKPTAKLLAATLGRTTEAVEKAGSTLDNAAMISVRRYINNHLHDSKLSPGKIAHHLGISRASLYRMCAKDGGIMEVIRHSRLERAKRLISHQKTGSAYIKSIAESLGFTSPSSFARAYKQYFGYAPTETSEQFFATTSKSDQYADVDLSLIDRRYEYWMSNLVA